MDLYLYKIGETEPAQRFQNVTAYTADTVSADMDRPDGTAGQAVFGPFPAGYELSSKADCTETLRADWRWTRAGIPGTLAQKKEAKLAELSAACSAAIVSGVSVETSAGTEHFSLAETDQINLTTALTAVQAGAAGYPYHADGQLCRMFSAEDIVSVTAAAVEHKLYHTTYHNHLAAWVRRCETEEELDGITFGVPLPSDLASSMEAILEASGAA